MSFGAPSAPMFKQLGIYDKFVSLAKISDSIQFYNEKREAEYKIEFPVDQDGTLASKL
jgi:hypothetical protein